MMFSPDECPTGGASSLLDRLRDDVPASPRGPAPDELRRQLLRDLQWLLNSHHYASSATLRPYEHVQRSVLNFGVPTLAGLPLSAVTRQRIQQDIAAAIRCFEPRILPQRLQVRCLATGETAGRYNLLALEIEGQLRGVPSPLPFLFHSQFDLETGHVTLQEVEW